MNIADVEEAHILVHRLIRILQPAHSAGAMEAHTLPVNKAQALAPLTTL
jgi:hypothetical protein